MPLVPPQIGPLNWDLHATWNGQTHTPFRLYIDPGQIKSSCETFPLFLQLPPELQLHIFRCCDNATLFQLMHVSSVICKEAKKLFWSNPETWFLINEQRVGMLLNGGYSGHTTDSIDALVHMKQIEVDFGCMEPFDQKLPSGAHVEAWEEDRHDKQPNDEVLAEKIHKFWETLKMRFPCATEVVLSQDGPFGSRARAPTGLFFTAEKCPKHIRASVSCLLAETDHYLRLKRSLWRQVRSASSEPPVWKITDTYWTRQSVLPPPKTFRGPVGAYCRSDYLGRCCLYLHFAQRILRIQALEAYYLDQQVPCVCPDSGCNLKFKLPGQWAGHAIDTSHDLEMTLPSEFLRISFEAHSAKLARIENECQERGDRLLTAWGQEGSKQREEAKHAFLHQLEHDPLYTVEKPVEESKLWLDYRRSMDREPGWDLR